jgi:hypothetical protein
MGKRIKTENIKWAYWPEDFRNEAINGQKEEQPKAAEENKAELDKQITGNLAFEGRRIEIKGNAQDIIDIVRFVEKAQHPAPTRDEQIEEYLLANTLLNPGEIEKFLKFLHEEDK